MSVDLRKIQSLADELSKDECPIPNFPIPDDCDATGSKFLEIKDVKGKGKGFFASRDIKAGTTILGSKPIAMVMQWEEGELDEEDEIVMDDEEDMQDNNIMKGSRRNGMLVCRLAKAIKDNPSVWFHELSNLYPREVTDALWVCECATTGMEIEHAVNELLHLKEFNEDTVKEIHHRLPLIVKYNCLSIETAPELFIHPNQGDGGHLTLSGTGLYYYPSYFNHSHQPNVARYSIGDVMFFVTNNDVKSGDELCISYIESEHLCESSTVRSRLLDMDFEEPFEQDESKGSLEKSYPIVDIDMQDEIMSLHPIDRLDEIHRLLKEVLSEHVTIDDDGDELHWFRCDEYQLRILLALTYDSLGQFTKALSEWKWCVSFAEENLPLNDESSVPIYVQAALCAQAAGQWRDVKEYSSKALKIHNLIFGGGVEFFRYRYRKEAELKLRPISGKVLSGSAALNVLWK
jgi:Proteins containing SET domain